MVEVFMAPSNWPSTNPYDPEHPVLNGSALKKLLEESNIVVDKPPHYNTGSIECIDYLKDNMTTEAFRGYLEGNTKKYMHRFRYKGKQLEDLKKAQWYLNYLIKEMETKDIG
jgi:hypothetical protein